MEEARSTISKIFNGEPRSYTRFNLTQNMEGENSQVEMKLSSDMDEETGNPVGEPNGYTHSRNSTYTRKPQRTPKNVCFMVIATLLIFVIGYLIGYLAHRRQGEEPVCAASSASDSETEAQGSSLMEVEPTLNWDDIKKLLRDKLSTDSLQRTFSDFSRNDHEAGSNGDEVLGTLVYKRFNSYNMNPWTDEHFVRLQGPPTGANRVLFNGNEIGSPRGYLAYSAVGKKQGKVVYANYGTQEDFAHLQRERMELNGTVILVRAGRISFAEKVANAERQNAVAVLIYPDPFEYSIGVNEELFGHVHLGSGDPYTPGFPSFNHTQFPPAMSSGLPGILAQTITADMATKLFKKMSGNNAPSQWVGLLGGVSYKMGGDNDNVTVEVNNVLTEKKIHNVFGVIKGFVDPDRYVVLGAQRDSWGTGFAKSTVGTSLLVELARVISDMVRKDGFKPRRSIVFASWSAGEFGSVGATEWLEGYLSSLNLKAFTYINLDGAVSGVETFQASASPLLYGLIEGTLKEVDFPTGPSGRTIYAQVAKANWEAEVMVPMKMDDSAYPFVAFTGIPSVSFSFAKKFRDYKFFGTLLDNKDNLNAATDYRLPQVAVAAAQVAGQMAVRLVHDHLLKLDIQRYKTKIRSYVSKINRQVYQLKQSGTLPENLTAQWLIMASGSYSRATSNLLTRIENSDLTDVEMCRIINDRLMRVEHNFLSPYVSPKETPFHHIFMGSGTHTLAALVEHLDALKEGSPSANTNLFLNQFALATWTIKGCSNALEGDIWELDNEM
ncbi:transferrin receptor 1b [Megalops cyprinoides]|uniref:transferrin receptor 1b n=1 Tax=Megalops cyprinoides TaxID=118141 RepID=UPI00186419EB|nr:transferrin receptor 1b [Megalops cyprinoides]